jgi:hypothetical protein
VAWTVYGMSVEAADTVHWATVGSLLGLNLTQTWHTLPLLAPHSHMSQGAAALLRLSQWRHRLPRCTDSCLNRTCCCPQPPLVQHPCYLQGPQQQPLLMHRSWGTRAISCNEAPAFQHLQAPQQPAGGHNRWKPHPTVGEPLHVLQGLGLVFAPVAVPCLHWLPVPVALQVLPFRPLNNQPGHTQQLEASLRI